MTPSPEERAKRIVYQAEDNIPLDEFEQGYQVELITKALKAYGDERVEEVIGVVESEPEMPDQMPDEMWDAIRNNRDACGESHRIAVRITKRNIVNNLRALKSQP